MTTATTVKRSAPSAELIKAAECVFTAMAWVETIRPKVEAIHTQVLAENNYPYDFSYLKKTDPEKVKELKAENDLKYGLFIRDHKHAYQMNDADFQEYLFKVNALQEAAGLYPQKEGNCPLLEAESMRREAERALIEISIDEMPLKVENKPTLDMITGSLEIYRKWVDLTLMMCVPYVRSAKEIMEQVD